MNPDEQSRQWDGSVDEQNLQDYRPVSVAAIVSLITGIVASAAIWLPGLSLVGAIAVFTGILAIYLHAKRPASFAWMAYIGIFLAICTTIWTQSARTNYQNHLLKTANEHSLRWLKMITDGEIEEAISLRMQYLDRPQDSDDLTEFFQRTDRPVASAEMTPSPAGMKQMFTETRTVEYLMESGADTKITPKPELNTVDTTTVGMAKAYTHYHVDFHLEDGTGQKKWTSADIQVEIYRMKFPTSVQWQVRQLRNLSAPDKPKPALLDPTGQIPKPKDPGSEEE